MKNVPEGTVPSARDMVSKPTTLRSGGLNAIMWRREECSFRGLGSRRGDERSAYQADPLSEQARAVTREGGGMGTSVCRTQAREREMPASEASCVAAGVQEATPLMSTAPPACMNPCSAARWCSDMRSDRMVTRPHRAGVKLVYGMPVTWSVMWSCDVTFTPKES